MAGSDRGPDPHDSQRAQVGKAQTFYESEMALFYECIQKCARKLLDTADIVRDGDFTPVLAKHSKSFSLIDCISVGVDRMQRNFEPMRKQVETWQRSELTDATAKVVIYEAFVEGKLEAPKHLARNVHDLYFEPKHEEFRPRTIWSLECFHLGMVARVFYASAKASFPFSVSCEPVSSRPPCWYRRSTFCSSVRVRGEGPHCPQTSPLTAPGGRAVQPLSEGKGQDSSRYI